MEQNIEPKYFITDFEDHWLAGLFNMSEQNIIDPEIQDLNLTPMLILKEIMLWNKEKEWCLKMELSYLLMVI